MSVGRDPEQSTGWSNHIWKILHCHRSGDDWGSTIGNFERKRCATREWKNRVLGQTSRGRLVRQEGRAGWIHEWRHEGKIDAERARERAGRSEWYTRERQHANAIYAKTETHVRPEPRYRYNWTIPNLHLSSSFLLSLFTPLQTLLSTRYVALSLLSLSLSLSSLSSLLFPSYCTSIILLPPFHRSQISLFFYRYSHFCHPCRSSVCWFVRPFVHSVIGPARIFVRFFSSLREIDEFPYPREYHSPSGKHRRQFLWEESRRDHRLPYGEYDFDRGCLVEAREIVLGTLIKLEALS